MYLEMHVLKCCKYKWESNCFCYQKYECYQNEKPNNGIISFSIQKNS